MNAIIEKIKNSQYGVFYQYPDGNGGPKFFNPKEHLTPLKVTREVVSDSQDSVTLKLNILNNSSKRLRINAAVISEFLWDIDPKLIEKVLVNGWVQSSDSQYIRGGIKPTKKKKLFLLRDQNPYSLREDFGYVKGSCISEWYTQLCLREVSLLAGAITVEKQFCQFYTKDQKDAILLRTTSQFDGITLVPGESIQTEEILFLIGDQKESLNRFAEIIKDRLVTVPPGRPIKGVCCSYYAQGNRVDYKYIERTVNKLDEIVQEDKKKDIVIGIDAGYSKWGDWLIPSKKFGSTIEDAAKLIKNHGYIPGIWISPFVVMKESNLYKEHSDWFIRLNGKPLESRQTSPIDFLPLLSLYVLDITKEEVRESIKEVIRKFREYGYDFIKIDFLYPSCFSQAYSKNVTRAQAIRMGVTAIREAAGQDAMIMSAISHLSPLVGLVNYARTGLDTSNPFVYGLPVLSKRVNEEMLTKNITNFDSRSFYDEKIWINDIDALVVNPSAKLSDKLINNHFERIMRSKARWIGDDISKLNDKLIDKYIKPILNE